MTKRNAQIQMSYYPAKTRVEITWDGDAFNYDVIRVGFRAWVNDYSAIEYTAARGRCSTERACELAKRLADTFGGTVYLQGVPFLSDVLRHDHPVGLVMPCESQIRPAA